MQKLKIRKSLILRGYIKALSGCPANLFYGTGIPACIIVMDKEGADERKHNFLCWMPAKALSNDGNKNRFT
jgi:type I restriction enzyme M protein